ncbi:cell division protein FtsL [Rhodobacteraceae bacterium]|nr:cell division protein FtsL [Paracoccaceae bacterium]
MRSMIYLATALCVLGLAFWAYRVNYDTQSKRDDLRTLEREIASLQEGLGVLKAEWAYLNRPDRLRELVNLNFTDLGLMPLQSTQFATPAQIPFPPPPGVTPQEEDAERVDVLASNDRGL